MQRPNRKLLVCIGGLVGTGKTTVTNALSTRIRVPLEIVDTGSVHFKNHGHVRIPDGPGDNQNVVNVHDVVTFIHDTVKRLRDHDTVIVTQQFTKPGVRWLFRQIAGMHGADFAGIFLVAPAEVSRLRAMQRQQAWIEGRPEPNNFSAGNPSRVDPVKVLQRLPEYWYKVDADQPQDVVLDKVQSLVENALAVAAYSRKEIRPVDELFTGFYQTGHSMARFRSPH
jgi:predicted kinase